MKGEPWETVVKVLNSIRELDDGRPDYQALLEFTWAFEAAVEVVFYHATREGILSEFNVSELQRQGLKFKAAAREILLEILGK